MRRSLFGLLILVALVGLVTTSCQRENTLRVVSIGNGATLHSDLSDFMVIFDKVDSEWVAYYQVPADSVQVELQYVEMGAGLPTWTPYQAHITQATVSVKSYLNEGTEIPYTKLTVPLDQTVPADPTGKSTTKFWFTIFPSVWKDMVFGDNGAGVINTDDPTSFNLVDNANATVTFSGYDSVANRLVSATGTVQVEFGNFYDDSTKFGK